MIAPVRRRLLAMAALVGAYLVLSAEALDQFGALTRWGALTSAALGIAVAALWWRRRGGFRWPGWHGLLAGWGRGDRLMVGIIGALLLGELMLALVSAPNTYDSMTYHLPRIEQWIQNDSLGPYPTQIHRQVSYPPGAEYVLLHLRLLTGGDWLYNLPQYLSAVLCLLGLTRIAAQLGGGRQAQLITAFVAATIPIVVLEASSTQTDLVMAAWVITLATIAIDFRPAGLDTLLIGVAAALVVITKPTGMFAAGPLLIWWAVMLAWRERAAGTGTALRRLAVRAGAVVLLTALIAGPYLARMQAEFGRPIGPPVAVVPLAMQRHDPAALVVNALRIGQTAFDTPVPVIRHAQVGLVRAVAGALHVDVNEPDITFPTSHYPADAWYPQEDRAAYPIQGTLVLLAVLVALVRPRRLGGLPRMTAGWACVVAGAALVYVTTVRWQPFGNRLNLFVLLLGVPLAGVLLERVFAARVGPGRGEVGRWLVATTLAVAAVVGLLSVGYGWPRRLVGPDNPFSHSRWAQRFVGHDELRPGFQWAAAGVLPGNPRTVGIIETNNSPEYPWYLLLPGRRLVALRSPRVPEPLIPVAQIDAVVCQASQSGCQRYLPPGFTLHWQDGFGYAVRS